MSTENRKQKYLSLIKDTGIFAIGTLGSKLILFFLVPLYTNCLSTAEYGTAELVITIGQLLTPFISIGIYEGMFRFALTDESKRNQAFFNAVLVFIFGSIVMVCITPLFSFYESLSAWKWYLAGYVVSNIASSTFLNFLKVKNKNLLFSILSILQALALIICNILFLIVLKTGINGYLISTIVSTSLVAIIAFWGGHMVENIRFVSFDSLFFKEMLFYSFPLVLNSVSWWIIQSSDKIMVELMISAAALGLYSAAAKIPSLLNIVTTIFSQAWRISSIKEYDSTNEKDFYNKVFSIYCIIIFGACIFINSIAKVFMGIYVGKNFVEAWRFVPLLLLSASFNAFSSYCGPLFEALKNSKIVMTTTLISGALNIAVNFALIPTIGIYGAVIGTLVSYMMIAILRMVLIHKKMKVNFQMRTFIPCCLIATVHALLITFNFNICWSSIVTCIIFSIINYRTIKNFSLKLIKKI